MSAEVTASISLESMESCLSLFGANNRNVPLLETELGIDLATRGADLRISGSEANVDLAVQVVEKIKSLEIGTIQ